jgi:hypothetical protein
MMEPTKKIGEFVPNAKFVNSGVACHVEYFSESDNIGRRSFSLRWFDDDGRPRGQMFAAVPHNIIEEVTP